MECFPCSVMLDQASLAATFDEPFVLTGTTDSTMCGVGVDVEIVLRGASQILVSATVD
jgi:hypothetical protein